MNDRAELVDNAAAAYRALADLAETIEDKLDRAMLEDIEDVLLRADLGTEVAGDLNGGLPHSPGAGDAVGEAIAEIGLITDPHRAIDWLSTFPHVVALALGGDVDGEPVR